MRRQREYGRNKKTPHDAGAADEQNDKYHLFTEQIILEHAES